MPSQPALSCTPSNPAVNSDVQIGGSGYHPGKSYRVEVTWPAPAGVADTAYTADANGNILGNVIAYFAGTTNVVAYDESNGRVLASASFTTA